MLRNDFIDFVKGVLIALVCIGHFIQYVVYENSNFWLDPLFKSIYMFHMPLFMGVAGYLSYSGISKATHRLMYLKNRALTYLLPIFSWAAIYQFIIFCANRKDVLDYPLTVLRFALNSLWFIWALLGAIVFTVVVQGAGKFRLIATFILFGVVLTLPDRNNLSLFKYVLPFFLVGYYLSALNFQSIREGVYRALAVILGVASILCFLIWDKDSYIYTTQMSLSRDNLFNVGFRWLAGGVVSLFSLMALYAIWSCFENRAKGILIDFGKNSLYIYVIQNYLFVVLSSMALEPINQNINIALFDLVAIIVGCFIAYFSWWIGCQLSRNAYIARWLFGKVNIKIKAIG